jgi:hypothetical protein
MTKKSSSKPFIYFTAVIAFIIILENPNHALPHIEVEYSSAIEFQMNSTVTIPISGDGLLGIW